ncbi:uncharacterized protein LOC134278839 isoform X2 [Saccostrea cucullata]|uniref:uncharacterized protein LOC134278839 isoform X2 n=1 Tax=Saccostrea cuccullata TaxID=36930 RepID=UPI002ECFE593
MHLFLISFLLGFKDVLLSESSCQMIQETIKYVPTCPHNKNEWFLAAENKNCSQYSKGCKEKLVYHCVPNHYENATLEVCVPVTLIVFGHCLEYSFLGKRVQANHNTECKTCPIFYKSNEAYKYKECYNISETTTTTPTTTAIHFSVTIFDKEITKHFEENITIPWNIHEKDG